MSGEGLQRARRRAWVGFATGLEVFNISVVYTIFVPFFIANGFDTPERGQVMWGYVSGIGGMIGALIAVPLGFAAERPELQRKFLALALALNAIPAFALWLAVPGLGGPVLLLVLIALAVVMAANDLNYALLGGMLADVAPSNIMGRTSAAAVSVGWAGGIVFTGVFLFLFVWGDPLGLRLDETTAQAERLIGPVSGAVLLLLGLPLIFLRFPRKDRPPQRSARVWLREEAASLLAERPVAVAIGARFFYWSGLVLVQLFGAGLARSIFGWDTGATSMFGLAVLAFGAFGALIGGFIDDRIGSRNALMICIIGLALAVAGLLSLQPDSVFLFIETPPRAEGAVMLSSPAEWTALALGAFSGLFIGPVGPITRSLISRLAPPDRVARYFGIGALAGNTSGAMAPFIVAIITGETMNQRIGLLVAPAFLLIGAVLLLLLPAARSARPDLPDGRAPDAEAGATD